MKKKNFKTQIIMTGVGFVLILVSIIVMSTQFRSKMRSYVSFSRSLYMEYLEEINHPEPVDPAHLEELERTENVLEEQEHEIENRIIIVLAAAVAVVVIVMISLFRLNKTSVVFSSKDIEKEYLEKAEEHIRLNERISLMLNASPLSCTLRDNNFGIFDCNEAALKLYKVKSKKEFIEGFSGFSPEYQPNGRLSSELSVEYVSKAYKEGEFVFEWTHQASDGTLFPAEVTIVRVGDENDDYSTIGYTRDLREQKRMMQDLENALKTEHDTIERARLILDNTPLICNLWDREGNIFDCNEAALKLFDLTDKEEYMKHFLEYTPEYQPNGMLTADHAEQSLREAFAKGECIFESTVQKADGTMIPLEVTLTRIPHEEDYIVVGFGRDLRDQKRMMLDIENALKAEHEANERTVNILDNTPLICSLWDRNYNVFDCNEEALRVFSLKEKSEYLEHFRDFAPETQPNGINTREYSGECLEAAFLNGKHECELMMQKPDGTPIPLNVTLIRIAHGDDDIVVGYGRDMRESRRIRARIEKRDRMLNTVNHMAGILLQSEDGSFDANLRRCMDMLRKEVEADRVSIWKNHTSRDGRLFCTQIYECLGDAESHSEKAITTNVSYDEQLPGWKEKLSKGEYINALVRDMSAKEQAQLLPLGIQSIFTVPVFVQDRFWGFVSYDNCHNEQRYSESEQSILHSGSLLLTNALVRHEMDHSIRETAAQLETVVKNHPGIIWRVDSTGTITLFNGMYIERLGVDPKRVIGQTLDKVPDTMMHPEIIKNIYKTYTEGAQEWVSKTDVGVFHLHTSPIYNEDGELSGMVGSIDEITEIIRLQDELQEALEKTSEANTLRNIAVNSMESILNSIDAFIYTNVPDTGEILFVNNYMKKVHGKTDEDMVGKKCYEVLRGGDDFCVNCPCLMIDKDSDEPVIWDDYIEDIGSHLHFYDCYIDWPSGEKVHLQYAIDVTELVTARELAEQSNRAKGIFLAQMSHEIRTPMNAILGISEIQLRGEDLSSEAEDGFRQIYDSGNLLLNIINDILDFSKIDAGKMEIVPEQYDIPSLINDTVQLCLLRYESKPILFSLNVDENTPLKLYGDALRIKQILNNLLSNAFKYTEMGEVKLTVSVEQGDDGETATLVCQVSDTGQGMKQDQLDRIFDEYSRFNMDTNHGVSGTGLGMNITKRLLNMMEGEIFVESSVGKGSLFTIRVPQKSCGTEVCGAALVESLRTFSFSGTSISKRSNVIHEQMSYARVLVVDDVASNLYVARGMLTPYGLEIETAKSGFEAVELIENGNKYDIVLMDHMMPKMDGIKTTQILRDMGYGRPIVALTANAISGQAEMFMSRGFDGFISKPIDSRELDMILKEFIREDKTTETSEAVQWGSREAAPPKKELTEIEKYFVMDVEEIVSQLEELLSKDGGLDDDDMESYTIAVHGMKSALANVGETKLSEVALSLEMAGEAREMDVIKEKTPKFIGALKSLLTGRFNTD